jgi:hypothetical protein
LGRRLVNPCGCATRTQSRAPRERITARRGGPKRDTKKCEPVFLARNAKRLRANFGKWELPAAGENNVGADRKPEGVVADHWNLDKYADDRKAGDDERNHKCKVHCGSSFRRRRICCHQICNGPNEVMAAWRASRDLQNKTAASFNGSRSMKRIGIRFAKSTPDSGNFEGSPPCVEPPSLEWRCSYLFPQAGRSKKGRAALFPPTTV